MPAGELSGFKYLKPENRKFAFQENTSFAEMRKEQEVLPFFSIPIKMLYAKPGN